MEPDLEDAVFRAPPREFTAARDALSAALKGAGRSDEAKAVKLWRRPTVQVWLWNRLVLDGEPSAREAARLASELAAAMARRGADGGELRRAIAALRDAGARLLVRARETA